MYGWQMLYGSHGLSAEGMKDKGPRTRTLLVKNRSHTLGTFVHYPCSVAPNWSDAIPLSWADTRVMRPSYYPTARAQCG